MNVPRLPLVSIVTIVYNGEAHIEQTIRSVIGQTYPNIEYIVIDGGSTDNTLSIVKKYEDHLACLISERDNGISDAFNKGLKRATGEIVGLINADDWYEKDAVEKVIENIGNADIAYGDLRLLKNGKTDFVMKGNHEHLEKEMTINHPTVFVKRSCYEKYGLFSEQYKCAMDYELMLRFKNKGCTFRHIPYVLANMRWEGLSDTQWILGCKESLEVKNKYLPSKRVANEFYFYKHIMAIAIPKFLQQIKMDFVVRGYRSRLSKIKKIYHRE